MANSHFLDLSKSLPIRLVAVLIYATDSIIGGAITGWLAPTHRLRNALVMGLIKVVTFAPVIPAPERYPLWLTILSIVVTVSASVLGGWLSQFIFHSRNVSVSGEECTS